MSFFGNFAVKALLKKQLKGVPPEQQDFLLTLIEKHPDFFMKIVGEVQEKTTQGVAQEQAMLTVMKAHEAEFKALLEKKP